MVSAQKPGPLPAWLERIYPFQPATFTTPQGASMSYLDEGPRQEEAVLMLHGNPTWSFYYRDLVLDLAPTRRCVVPDHVGMGLSAKPAKYAYTLASRIADVEALVDSLGLRRVHLVVHDWGGAIGFGLAVRRPDLVGRIVIMNTAAFVSKRIPKRIELCRAPVIGELIVRGLNGFAEPATFMAMAMRRMSWDERKGFLYPYDSWAHRIAIDRFVRDIPLEPRHPSRAVLEGIEAGLPTLAGHEKMLLWGVRDFCFDESFLARWLEIFPDARLERLERAGHYVLEDAGAEARSRIAAFLL